MGGTSSSNQVDLYSAKASTGIGAVCFASGSLTAIGCTGETPNDFYNLGVKSSYTQARTNMTLNMDINSGP